MHSCNQANCKHESIKFCSHCGKVYCEKCGREWEDKCMLNHYNNWYYTYPCNPWTTTPIWAPTGTLTTSSTLTGNDLSQATICTHAVT